MEIIEIDKESKTALIRITHEEIEFFQNAIAFIEKTNQNIDMWFT